MSTRVDGRNGCLMLAAEASVWRLDRQVFWLTARNGPRTAFPREQWHCIRRPGRLQRRPRNGISPFSLLSPRAAGNQSSSQGNYVAGEGAGGQRETKNGSFY